MLQRLLPLALTVAAVSAAPALQATSGDAPLSLEVQGAVEVVDEGFPADPAVLPGAARG